jgi:hypothetical protein
MASIFYGWNILRLLRLLIGIGFLVAFFTEEIGMYGFAGVFFIALAFFNVGCAGQTCCTQAINTTDACKVKLKETRKENAE